MLRLAWTLVACVVLHVVWTYARRKKRTQYVDAGAERVLILGASTPDGLGAELLRQYVERGAKHIMIVGRREHALDDVRKRFPRVQVHVHAADLTCTQSVLALRDAVVRCMGGLDTLHMVFGATSILPILGVAGVDPCGVNAETEERGLTHATQDGLNRIGETVQRSCDANVKGPAIVLGALIPLMQTTSSRPAVVTIGSVAGLGVGKGVAQVGKYGLRGLPAWMMHRGYHAYAMPTLERKARILGNWAVGMMFGRDASALMDLETPRHAFVDAANSKPAPKKEPKHVEAAK